MNLKTLLILTISLALSCTNSKAVRFENAKKDADFIFNNLNNERVFSHFNEAFFKKDIINEYKTTCNWTERQGKYIDHFSYQIDNNISTSFLYEYFLNCDSLRFILSYNMDNPQPILNKFEVEPLEKYTTP